MNTESFLNWKQSNVFNLILYLKNDVLDTSIFKGSDKIIVLGTVLISPDKFWCSKLRISYALWKVLMPWAQIQKNLICDQLFVKS